MNCMKCGRETLAGKVFCEDCLLEMEKYPVKPGTVVFLPRRRENTTPKKTSKRRALPLEEQVKVLKKRVKILTVLLVLCIGILLAAAYPAVQHLREDHFKPGQNYTSVTSGTASQNVTEAAD